MTLAQALQDAVFKFKRRRLPEALANAEFLMAHVLGSSRNAIFFEKDRALKPQELAAFKRLCLKRLKRVPLAHLFGAQAFLDFELKTGPQALVPRPETEELALAAMKAVGKRRLEPLRVWDLGAGTGCLAVALARHFPKARILATDISPAALALVRANARKNGVGRRVRARKDDFYKPQAGPRPRPRAWADLAVSNPPYIPTRELPKLMPEVRREPRLALDGGQNGLAAIAAVIERVSEALKPGGVLALEFGRGQSGRVCAMLALRGFKDAQILKDAQGLERIALVQKTR